MYRGCRRWVCLLVCVFSILSMLFLDTCTVKASSADDLIDNWVTTSASSSVGLSLTLNPTDNVSDLEYLQTAFSFSESGTISTISNVPSSYRGSGSGTISNTTSNNNINYYNYHFEVPLNCYVPSSGVVYSDMYGYILIVPSVSCTVGSISNFHIRKGDDVISLIGTSSYPITYMRGYELTDGNGGNVNSIGFPAIAEFDFTFSSKDYDITDVETITPYVSFTMYSYVGHISSTVTEQEIKVSDTVSQEKLESIESTSQDTNTKITDFFGNFFDNLLHIFVPEDGYFSTWFDKLNNLLSEKLGMLYAPFDLVISTLQAIYSSSTSESGIPFPGIKWEDTWLIEPFTFTFASLGSSFDDLREKVYFATDTVLVFTFLMLLQKKIKLILEGHE